MPFQIDKSRSKIGFSVKHMMISTVRGSFSKFDAALDVNPERLAQSQVSAQIHTSSVSTNDRLRDEYLVGKDFFNPALYPTMDFRSSGVRLRGKQLVVNGHLSIRGQSRPIVLEGSFSHQHPGLESERLVFQLGSEVDRESYRLVFNGAVETVSVVVGKKVKLDLLIELIRV